MTNQLQTGEDRQAPLERPTNPRATLSSLWIFVQLSTLVQEMHEIVEPGWIDEVRGGTLNGTDITDELLVGAGLVMQIPLLMIVLNHVLPAHINKWANTVIALITAIALLTMTSDPDDVLFALTKGTALLAIVVIAQASHRLRTLVRNES
ncbi:MAG: DUF6326 family protein [Acidimicrobiia bacterium]|nr:DUF6326 family protein [Acidimicrobiia bacterium]